MWSEVVCDRHRANKIARVQIRSDGKVAPTVRKVLATAIGRDGADRDEWREFLGRVSKSQFLTGYGPAGWKATLVWACSPTNRAKIEAGNYDGLNSARSFNVSQHERAKQDRMSFYQRELSGGQEARHEAEFDQQLNYGGIDETE